MPDYSKSKIYKLQCDDGYFYIGSTRNELRIRLRDHKNDCMKNRHQSNVYQHIKEIGWNRVRIVLVEDYSCENKDQLRQREDYHIQQVRNDPFCLNINRAFSTEQDKRDYYKRGDNTIARRDFDKKKQKDKERYNQKRIQLLTPYTCVCGSVVVETGRRRHEKTQRHQHYLASSQEI